MCGFSFQKFTLSQEGHSYNSGGYQLHMWQKALLGLITTTIWQSSVQVSKIVSSFLWNSHRGFHIVCTSFVIMKSVSSSSIANGIFNFIFLKLHGIHSMKDTNTRYVTKICIFTSNFIPEFSNILGVNPNNWFKFLCAVSGKLQGSQTCQFFWRFPTYGSSSERRDFVISLRNSEIWFFLKRWIPKK